MDLIEFTVPTNGADKALQIVRTTQLAGYKLGQDFDFEYVHGASKHQSATKHTIFYIYNTNLSSWFALKFL